MCAKSARTNSGSFIGWHPGTIPGMANRAALSPTPAEPERLLLSVQEVAATLGLGVRTVWRLASARRLAQPVRIGRAVRWRRQDVLDFVEALRPGDEIETGAPPP